MTHFPRSRKPLPLLAALLLAACANPSTDSQSLQEGFQKYSAFKAAESEAIANRYLAANPNASDLDQAYYLRGISRMTNGNRAGAASDLRTAITKTTRADLRTKAYRALGDIAYDQQQWADTLKSYLAALDNLALDPATITYLNFRMGATYQAQGEWTRAEPWFNKVVTANNDPTYYDRAQRRLHARFFALQFGAFQDIAGARALAATLSAASISATATPEVRDNKLWYLVQSGSYPTLTEALQARDRVLPRFPTATIVP